MKSVNFLPENLAITALFSGGKVEVQKQHILINNDMA
jgi:hypothetical protein